MGVQLGTSPVVVLGLAAVYVLAGKLGLLLAFVNASTTAVWPPTGIALAAFLLLGYRVWPGIFLGAFLVNLTTAGSVATTLGIATGNTLEGLAGAYLVNRFAHGAHAFDRPQDVFKFAVLAALACMTVSPFIGVTSLALGGYADWAEYGRVWLTWWLGDAGGALIVAPVLLLWGQDPRARWTLTQVKEVGLLLVTLLLVGLAVFGGVLPITIETYRLGFVCIPVLVWTAFRFGRLATGQGPVLNRRIEITALRRDGTEFPVELSILPLKVGASYRFNAFIADISERLRAKEELERMVRDLMDALAQVKTMKGLLPIC